MKIFQKPKSKSIFIAHLLFLTASLLIGIFSCQVQARECYFENIKTTTINVGTLTVNSFNPSSTTPTLLGTFPFGRVATVTCNNGNDGRYHIVTTFSINLIKFCELTYFPACFSFIGNTPAFCTNPVFVINF